jgi:hypothetical protein
MLATTKKAAKKADTNDDDDDTGDPDDPGDEGDDETSKASVFFQPPDPGAAATVAYWARVDATDAASNRAAAKARGEKPPSASLRVVRPQETAKPPPGRCSCRRWDRVNATVAASNRAAAKARGEED